MKSIMSVIDNFLFLLYECILLVIDLSKGTIDLTIKLSAMCFIKLSAMFGFMA